MQKGFLCVKIGIGIKQVKINSILNGKNMHLCEGGKSGICEGGGMLFSNEVDKCFMNMAIKEARKAMAGGDVPIGCVIVDNATCEVVAKAYNKKERGKDATAHAEIICIRKANKIMGDWRLENCSLYVTLEPCPMCFGAILSARVGRVVFGASDEGAGFLGGFCDYSKHNMLNHSIEVVADILGEECRQLLRGFFRQRRAENKAKRGS